MKTETESFAPYKASDQAFSIQKARDTLVKSKSSSSISQIFKGLLASLIVITAGIGLILLTPHLLTAPLSIQPIWMPLTFIGLSVCLTFFLRYYSQLKPETANQYLKTIGLVVMQLSGASVSAFTAGAFVHPVSIFLDEKLGFSVAPGLGISVTLVLFVLASLAWYQLYTRGEKGMLRWWEDQFLSKEHAQLERTHRKLQHLLDKTSTDDSGREQILWAAIRIEKDATHIQETNIQGTDRQINTCLWVAKEIALNFKKTPDSFHDSLCKNAEFEAHIEDRLKHYDLEGLTQEQQEAMPQLIQSLFVGHKIEITASSTGLTQHLEKHITKYNEQSDSDQRWWVKLGVSFAKCVGFLNALIANSTGNVFGLIGIATTFPLLHLTTLPLGLKIVLLCWAFSVGFFAAAALTAKALEGNIKLGIRSFWSVADPAAEITLDRWIAQKLTVLFSIATGIALATFNYQAAAFLVEKLALYQVLPTSWVPATSLLSSILGYCAFFLTVFASTAFFLKFSLAQLTPKNHKQSLIVQFLNDFLFESVLYPIFRTPIKLFKNTSKLDQTPERPAQTLRFLFTLLCAAATTIMLNDAMSNPMGIIAAKIGMTAATWVGFAAVPIIFYLLSMLFYEGFGMLFEQMSWDHQGRPFDSAHQADNILESAVVTPPQSTQNNLEADTTQATHNPQDSG